MVLASIFEGLESVDSKRVRVVVVVLADIRFSPGFMSF